MQIEHLLARRPAQLSGGQRQRVAMGRALVRDPRLFLFDEPLSNLDAKLRVDMRTEIKRLHHRTGATIVYVTHDQIEAMTLATKIAVMKDGILQQVGTPSEIYNQPGQSVRRRLHGLAGDEPARSRGRGGGGANEPRLTLSAQRRRADHAARAGRQGDAGHDARRQIILGIRPEAITDEGSADRSAETLDTVSVLVDVVEPAGSDTLVVTTYRRQGSLRPPARRCRGQARRYAAAGVQSGQGRLFRSRYGHAPAIISNGKGRKRPVKGAAMRQGWRWFGPNDPVSLSDIGQAGATDIVTALHHKYEGQDWSLDDVLERKAPARRQGSCGRYARASRFHSHQDRRGGRGAGRRTWKTCLRSLGRAGVPLVCYNFMPVVDWTRTDLDHRLPMAPWPRAST